MKLRLFTFPILLLVLTACQTKYQEGDITGGVKAQQITQDTYRITARGNSYTSDATIQDYVLLKAAETTLGRQHTHFQIVGSKDTTRTDTQQTASTANVIGGTLWVNPGTTYDIVRPGQDTIIKILKIADTETAPVGSHDARQIYKFINARVERPKS